MRSSPLPLKLLPLELSAPRISTDWLAEPELVFGQGRTATDPKVGIALYGPKSLGSSRHRSEISVGIIGTSETAGKARQLFETCAAGIDGDTTHTPFPGCTPDVGFRCQLSYGNVELIRQHEYEQILQVRRKKDRFLALQGMLDEKMGLICERDHHHDYIVVALPDEFFKKCSSIEYTETGVGSVYRNLRRVFKARSMRFESPRRFC